MKLAPIKAVKGDKKRKLRVIAFPAEGGRPRYMDVEPDDEGLFKLDKDSAFTFRVAPGSVWEEDGKLRTIVHEGSPLTISASTLRGDDIVSPTALSGIAENNLWAQIAEIARRKNQWRQASTWIMIVLAVVLILTILWLVQTTGNGLEELRNAINALDLPGSASSDHQDISPEG